MPTRRVEPPGLAARWALRAIGVYQRHLSPRKGFSCAHRGATGGDSCSAHGCRVIARCGLRTGLRLLQRRLDACGRQHRCGAGPLRYQQGSIDLGCAPSCDACDLASGACDLLGNWGSCDLGSWRRSAKKPTVNDADFDALRARVEAAKRRNAQGD